MAEFLQLNKLQKGDHIGVISPSSGLPEKFPAVYELGLKRLEEEFGFKPVEYPTTRKLGSSLEDRARDIMAAFSDTSNKAVFASIGGDDQIKLIKLLNKQIFLDNPKPFFGYSDNTHLQMFLWSLEIPSYYGGGIMNQFGMNQKMHDFTVHYLNLALFEHGEFELKSSEEFNDEGLDWRDSSNLEKPRKMEKNDGWYWDGNQSASGILWGGCLESVDYQLRVGIYLPNDEKLKATVLFLETSEEIPPADYVKRVMTALGERGLLESFSAFLVGRPKAWEFDKPNSPEEKEKHRKEQREVMVKVIREYNSDAPIVMNMDFGHTDPQIILPVGRKVNVDAENKKITAEY